MDISNLAESIMWKDIWSISRGFFLSKQSFLSIWLYDKTKAKIATVLFVLLLIIQEWCPISIPNFYELTRGIRLGLFVYAVLMLVARNDRHWDELISTCQQHINELEQLDGAESKEFYRKQQQDFIVMYTSMIIPTVHMIVLGNRINKWCEKNKKNWRIDVEGGLLIKTE
jgi:hypothetical protein